ncbi:hypothetical protein [Bacillus sp. P14.5]|uniref:hypothetical protein n=1 Tax=Bacillus sp. P14.5 TaxID=1983400 RepID=UPI0019633B19|nr:hypothetical protein [Bacillus sp. P14.5]
MSNLTKLGSVFFLITWKICEEQLTRMRTRDLPNVKKTPFPALGKALLANIGFSIPID